MVHRSAKVNKRRLPLGLFLGTYFGNTTLQVANVSGKLDFFSIFCFLFCKFIAEKFTKARSEINRVQAPRLWQCRRARLAAIAAPFLLSHDWLDIVLYITNFDMKAEVDFSEFW